MGLVDSAVHHIMAEDIKLKVKLLHDAAFLAKQHYQIWKLLEDIIDRQGYQKIWDHYYKFFEPTRRAHFVSMVMAIWTIFDPDHGLGHYAAEGNNCEKFIKKISGEIPPQNRSRLVCKIRKILKQRSKSIGKICQLRHENLAHVKSRIEDVLKRIDLRREDCRDVVYTVKNLLNDINRAFGEAPLEPDLHGDKCLYQLLGVLKKDLKVSEVSEKFLKARF